ncbi:hypothetical protein [Paraburkholderia flagellata]|uniref:hypothetical protein n=1 Tax=Paraburkholderia flagellata TaxID=2883241 RepID=UPI001F26E7A3|nr:hypothetical protein [Paraburkholderia flagellata]
MLGRAMKRPLAWFFLATYGAAASLLRAQQSIERDGARPPNGICMFTSYCQGSVWGLRFVQPSSGK